MAEPLAPIKEIHGQISWRPADNSGVVYDATKIASMPATLAECDGYRERLSDNDGWIVERSYQCQWSDVAAAMQWLRGYSRASPGGGGISRITPAQDPYRPYLYCTDAQLVEPEGAPLQDPGTTFSVTEINTETGEEEEATNYIPATVWAEKQGNVFSDGMAKLKATFRTVPYVVRSDLQMANSADAQFQGELCRYVERVPRYAIQGIPLASIAKASQLYFVGTTTLVPEAGVLLMPTQSWRYTWHDVPFYPSTAIESAVGRINKDPFDGVAGWPLFPAGTLLCQAPEIIMKRNASGAAAFDVTWILDYRPQGWNYFPTGAAGFALATFGGLPPAPDGSNLVFKPAPFGILFSPGPAIFFV